MPSAQSLEYIFESLQSLCEENETLSVEEIKDHFKTRGFGPLLLIPAIITLLPVGGIPVVPSICGIITMFVSAQMLFGKSHPWLPRKIEERYVEAEKLNKGTDRMIRYAKKIDRYLKPRLTVLAEGLAHRLIAFMCFIMGAIMIPLEAVPFASAAPALTLFCLGLGMTVKDGVLLLTGTVMTIGALTASYYTLMSVA